MAVFKGFSEVKARLTPIPAQFFAELLPEIDHLGELKVTLYAIWKLNRQEGQFRFLRRQDFLEDQIFMAGLTAHPAQFENALDDALERAVGRGTFLRATLAQEGQEETYYFLNSPKGMAAVEAIRAGKWKAVGPGRVEVQLDMERPNIYRLYEKHFGPLTPLIAEALLDAEKLYPADWIEQAIRIAVENNVRRWRYVEAILNSWKEKGHDEQDRKDSEKDRRRYIEGEYADFIEH
jgi:DnaD/phage-associated family protein